MRPREKFVFRNIRNQQYVYAVGDSNGDNISFSSSL